LIFKGYFEFGQYVVRVLDEHGPLTQQRVTAARLGGVDGTWDREDLPTLLGGAAGGGE
jgi:hypothetical protein